jgi:hypothetical protein
MTPPRQPREMPRMKRIAPLLLLCACHGSATRQPVHAKPSALPSALQSCSTIGAQQDGKTCSIYDTKAKAFSDTPDGTPEDALARRAFLYERWLDLYNAPGKQPVVRRHTQAFAAGTPESVWSDPKYHQGYDDEGDSAGFSDDALNAALYHYAVTGTDADYARFESWARGLVMQWDVTGMDGYLARFAYAGVPSGTQLTAGLALDHRDVGDNGPFDAPASALPRLPSYFKDGIDIGGKHIATLPSWIGHTSIDAYSGSMNSFPLAYDLIKDPDLKARMARHYGCFLKRLRIFKIINLSKNPQLQADFARYLTSTVLKLDPDDPDLTRIDQIWGFYLPQYNRVSAATFDTSCPAHLATDAAPTEIVDVAGQGYTDRLFNFILRQSGGDNRDSIDFAFYPSARAGDAVMLDAYALGAYHMTGDHEFLDWREQVLNQKANAKEISRTIGAFNPPEPCRSYYRTPNLYLAHYMRTQIENDSSSRDFAVMLWKRKFAAKEVFGLRDAFFEMLYAAALGEKGAGFSDALQDLLAFGGTPDHLDDPRRNYALDLTPNPPPGTTVALATSADIATCSQPITVLGVTVPIDHPDPNVRYVNPAPPAALRPPDNWIWEKDPFAAARLPGDAGMQQYHGLDLIEPYWVARYHGLLPDAHLVLAWR